MALLPFVVHSPEITLRLREVNDFGRNWVKAGFNFKEQPQSIRLFYQMPPDFQKTGCTIVRISDSNAETAYTFEPRDTRIENGAKHLLLQRQFYNSVNEPGSRFSCKVRVVLRNTVSNLFIAFLAISLISIYVIASNRSERFRNRIHSACAWLKTANYRPIIMAWTVFACCAAYLGSNFGFPGAELDPSWIFGMNAAAVENMRFGQDIVFTYGPYTSFITKGYHPELYATTMLTGAFMSICLLLAAFRVFRTNLQLLFFNAGLVFASHIDAWIFFHIALIAIAGITLFESDDEKRRPVDYLALVVIVAPLGFLPFTKGSLLPYCGLTCIVLLTFFLLRKRWLHAVLTVGGICLTGILAWTAAEQPLASIADYVRSLIQIIGGYTEAMAVENSIAKLLVYLVMCLVIARYALPWFRSHSLNGVFVALAVCLMLLITFKTGAVRGHLSTVAGVAILLPSILTLVFTGRRLYWLSALCALCFLIITPDKMLPRQVTRYFAGSISGYAKQIFDHGHLRRDYDYAIRRLKARGEIPALEGTVDLYAYEQGLLLASDNRWNPRPVFQSYSAYTPKLIANNKQHLLGANHPDHIFFKVQTIDKRLPSLDDGASWPALLSLYEPEPFDAALDEFVQLKRKRDKDEYAEPETIATRRVRMGEEVLLPEADSAIMAYIDISKSTLGTLASLPFKPGRLRISITLQSGEVRSYRIISTMASEGFLLSPLVESAAGFHQLYLNAPGENAVKSISIQPFERSWSWEKEFSIRFARLTAP